MRTAIAILLMLTCTSYAQHADTNQSWAVGRWVVAAASRSPTNGILPHVQPDTMEKHVIVFSPIGRIQRYSPSQGLNNLLFGFKTVETNMFLHGPQGYRPAGHLDPHGRLVMDFRRGRIVVYERITSDVPLADLALDGKVTIRHEERGEGQQHGGQISSEGAPSAPPNESSP